MDSAQFSRMGLYETFPCRRPIKMSLLCQIEMTLPGGFAELAYEPSVLKRARSNDGSGFLGRCIGRRAGAAPARRPTPTMVTSLSGGHIDTALEGARATTSRKQIGRALALRWLSRRPQPPFARGNGDLPLPKPVKRATLAAKPRVSGECRRRPVATPSISGST